MPCTRNGIIFYIYKSLPVNIQILKGNLQRPPLPFSFVRLCDDNDLERFSFFFYFVNLFRFMEIDRIEFECIAILTEQNAERK